MDTATLPRHAYHHLMYTLRRNLPPAPPDPAVAIARDYAMIAQVSSLCPANAAEAAIAAQVVAANAQAMETMGLANDPTTEPHRVTQCVAQVASMMRQAQGALRVLLSMQAERRRRDADSSAASSSAWIEYGAARWMEEALPVHPARVSENDPKVQNAGRHPALHEDGTESADRPASFPDAGLSQNENHDLIRRSHETDSGVHADPSSDTGGMGQSQNPGHILVMHSHETDSSGHRDPPGKVAATELSQNQKQILTPYICETESVGGLDSNPVLEIMALSQDTTHVLVLRSHETKSDISPTASHPTVTGEMPPSRAPPIRATPGDGPYPQPIAFGRRRMGPG